MGKTEISLYSMESKMSEFEKTIKKTEKVIAAFEIVKSELEVTKAYNKQLEKTVKLQKLVLGCSLSALLISSICIVVLIIP